MRLLDYLREDIWTEDLRRGPLVRRAFVGGLRVLLHAVSAFSTDLGPLRPAGLTMVTLLSLVPLLAIVSGIAQAFGYQEYLQQFIDENTQELPENVRMGVAQIQEAVDRADFQTLRLIGSAVLIWSIMTLFIRVESALNFTWHTRQRRPWLRRISDFVALIVLFPVLALAALSANSVVASASGMEDLPAWVEWIVQVSSGGLTHVVMWLAMTALFRFMPSADVKWKWAFLSGVIAGSGWLFTHQLWIAMQIGMARANAIYATVAAFPLLIVYLQTVWTVILFGAEVGYGATRRPVRVARRSARDSRVGRASRARGERGLTRSAGATGRVLAHPCGVGGGAWRYRRPRRPAHSSVAGHRSTAARRGATPARGSRCVGARRQARRRVARRRGRWGRLRCG
jgi:membrane protein